MSKSEDARTEDDILRGDLPEYEVTVREVAVRDGDEVSTSWRAEADGHDVTAGGETPTEAFDVLVNSITEGTDDV